MRERDFDSLVYFVSFVVTKSHGFDSNQLDLKVGVSLRRDESLQPAQC